MSNHILTTSQFEQGTWRCWCECGIRSPACVHRWEAEDWGAAHLREVERVRAHLRDRNPGLRDQARWFRKQEQEAVDPNEKALWAMLAEGLEHRLGVAAEETPLFEENV